MAEVTIIIPNYNGMKYLPACMESLQAQVDAPAYDILIVDNGSSDESVGFLRETYPEVRLIALPENTGFCHAVNVGIEASNTPYVILLNNDTKADSGFVGALYRAIAGVASAEGHSPSFASGSDDQAGSFPMQSAGERDEAGISADENIFSVSAKMLMWDRPNLVDDAGDRYTVLGWAYGRGKGKPAAAYNESVRIFSACGGAAIYKRSVFEEIGLFDELHFAYLEDLDIGYRAAIHGYRNLYEPRAGVLHYGSASTGSRYNPRKTELSSANNVYVIAKNMPLLQWIWNLPFLLIGFLGKWLFFCKKGMGALYLKGIGQGLARASSREGRAHKVRFSVRNLPHYLYIQGQLYANTLRFLKKN